MQKYPTLYVAFKTILSFFAATVLCAVFFTFPTSAAISPVEWTTTTLTGSSDYYYYITDSSTGTMTVSDGTLYVSGNDDNIEILANNLEVVLQGNSSVVWTPNIRGTSSGNVTISGSGSSIEVTGDIIPVSNSNPSLNITADVSSIYIHDTEIVGGSGASANAVNIASTGAAVTIHNAGIKMYDGNATAFVITSGYSLTLEETEILCLSSSNGSAMNISGLSTLTGSGLTTITDNSDISNISTTNPAILCASNLTIDGGSTGITSSYNTAIRQTGGTLTVKNGNITGGNPGPRTTSNGVYGISAEYATIILEGGNISSASTDTDTDGTGSDSIADAAVKLADSTTSGISNLTIRGGVVIDGGNVYGVVISNLNSDYGTHTMSGGTVKGKIGITVGRANSLWISGNSRISANTYSTREEAAVSITDVNALTISGNVVIDGSDSVDGDTDANGVLIHDTIFHEVVPIYCTLTMTGGTVQGESGFHLSGVGATSISGGTITKTGTADGAAIHIGTNDLNYALMEGDMTISGNVIINGGTKYGIQVVDYVHSLSYPFEPTLYIQSGTISGTTAGIAIDRSIVTLNISGGDISGGTGVELQDSAAASITGGNITANGSGGDAGVDITGSGTTPTTTIGGTVRVNAASTDAIRINNSSASLTITNGTFSGANGLQTSIYSTLTIEGGTFSGSGINGQGIRNTGNKAIKIKPTAATPVLLKGVGQALSQDYGGSINLENVVSYITSVNTSGTPSVGTNTATAPFVNSSTYKYVKFLATALTKTPTTSTPSPEPSNNNSGSGGEPYYNPTTPNSVSYSKDEYILVIATLNKSGSVNSKETAKDMWLAEQRAKQFNIPKIYLKIPEGGTGISAAALKKQYDTAKKTRLYLLFDYYETVIDKNGKEKNNVIGSVFTPVNAKSGQFLTGIKFDSKNIDSVESYIKKKWNTTILGSFETTQKGGWYDTAKITIDIDNLGFSADNGTRLYALIYDTKAKKFYQTDVTVSKGNAIINTNRSGVVVIVNKSIK
ncbi:MAG: hypothetical protein LBL87_05060 [Ruminococcus sp.]|nr:hypothetical protein [Ruminococcus sp.]